VTTFDQVAEIIMKMKDISGRNDKISWLKYHQDFTGFKEILHFIFNPYVHTGIGAQKLKKNSIVNLTVDTYWQDIINHFKAHQTGSDADVAMAQTFILRQATDDARALAIAIVTQDLKIGVTETTLNQVWGTDFIPKIGIMRGQHYKDNKSKVTGPFIVTEKHDGARRIIVKENGHVSMYTRSGHLDEGLVDLENEARYLPDNTVYDCEALAIGEFENSIALRQATNAIANSKGIRHGLEAKIFDMIPVDEFKRGKSKHSAVVRKTLLAAMFKDEGIKHIAPIENIALFGLNYDFKFLSSSPILGLAVTEDEIMAITQPIWDRHYEGTMLNTLHGYYVVSNSPSRDLLKVKATEEFTLLCTGVYEGKPGTEIEGMLGGIYLSYKGHRVGCGSGFNHDQRRTYWNNPELIVGGVIEGDHFGETTNKQGGISINCPIFKRVVGTVE
jgi:DNA ligase-1